MSRTKQAKHDAKQLFHLCLVGGLLDEGRVREVVRRVAASGNRDRFKVLAEFRHLVKLNYAQHTATVETAAPLATGLVLVRRIAGLVMLGILGTPPMRAQAQAPAAPVLEVASVKPVPASENAASFAGKVAGSSCANAGSPLSSSGAAVSST